MRNTCDGDGDPDLKWFDVLREGVSDDERLNPLHLYFDPFQRRKNTNENSCLKEPERFNGKGNALKFHFKGCSSKTIDYGK